MRDGIQTELFGFAPPREVVDVAVAARIPHLLSYAVPPNTAPVVGSRVRVPLQGREVEGFVVRCRAGRSDDTTLRELTALPPGPPVLTPVTLELGLWLASHYGAAPGECLQTVVPAPVRSGIATPTIAIAHLTVSPAVATQAHSELLAKGRSAERRAAVLGALIAAPGHACPLGPLLETLGVTTSPVHTLERAGLIAVVRRQIDDETDVGPHGRDATAPDMTPHQTAAVAATLNALTAGRHQIFLLDGVTGSGKTEVYLRTCAAALAAGRAVIMLVPEIALTPQTVERFRTRLGPVAVLHSNQSDSVRARAWERLRSGELRVALGPRSALFAPLKNVGVIVVDEEHESTFKQQNAPRYHARDVACRRGAMENAVVILGSATPSLESEWQTRSGGSTRLELPTRVKGIPMPAVHVIDMRNEKPMGPGGLFSTGLFHQVREALVRKEQVILFLNRRGFSTQVLCKRCGWRGRCAHCDVNLTYYRGSTTLLCHYCGERSAPPERCPDCRAADVRYQGAGTEKVVEAASVLFPGARLARMDGETLEARGEAERLYQALRAGEIDILVGTQVIAKGIDIPGITVIGVINADTALLIPDFRSAERTFQLLCQVAGRAGRGDRPGTVLIQTFEPEHYAVLAAAHHDTRGFAETELAHRRASGYPPFGSLVRIVIQGSDAGRVETRAAQITGELRERFGAGSAVTIIGPAPCPIPLIKGHHRWHLIAKTTDPAACDLVLAATAEESTRDLRVIVDRDPVALM